MSIPEDVTTFDPLLRDLVRWGLVRQDEAKPAAWVLTPEAQRRLAQLGSRVVPPAERLVYLGRRCGVCGGHGLTRLQGERYVCAPCTGEVSEPAPGGSRAENDPVTERRVRARHLRRRGGREGASRLAS